MIIGGLNMTLGHWGIGLVHCSKTWQQAPISYSGEDKFRTLHLEGITQALKWEVVISLRKAQKRQLLFTTVSISI